MEFFIKYSYSILLLLNSVCLILALAFQKKFEHTYWRCLNCAVGVSWMYWIVWLIYPDLPKWAALIAADILNIVEHSLYFLLYAKYSGKSTLAFLVRSAGAIYIFFGIMELFLKNDNTIIVPFYSLIGDVFLFAISVCIILKFIFSPAVINYHTEIIYWFTLGLMMPTFVGPLCEALIDMQSFTFSDGKPFSDYYIDRNSVIRFLPGLVYSIMYILFSIGFICAKFAGRY